MSKEFIKSAIKKPGSLRKTLGVSKTTGKTPATKIASSAKKSGVTGKRARSPMTLSKLRKKK